MLSAAVLTLLAAGPAAASSSVVASPAVTIVLNSPRLLSGRTPRGRDEVRQSYKQALRHANKLNTPDPLSVTPELLALYWELDNPKSMPPTERGRMRRVLRGRLRVMRDKLVRLRNKHRPRASRVRRTRIRTRVARRSRPAAAAGGTAARAAQLIDLIRNTIAPESWAVNGGLGTISFYGSPLYVLVVRNTSEVHHQIGGAFPAIRR
ncbi:MAG: hypothetical protein ACE5KM_20210 [Planctomycetaceae bacterium]